MFCIVKIINLLAPRSTPGTPRPQAGTTRARIVDAVENHEY